MAELIVHSSTQSSAIVIEHGENMSGEAEALRVALEIPDITLIQSDNCSDPEDLGGDITIGVTEIMVTWFVAKFTRAVLDATLAHFEKYLRDRVQTRSSLIVNIEGTEPWQQQLNLKHATEEHVLAFISLLREAIKSRGIP